MVTLTFEGETGFFNTKIGMRIRPSITDKEFLEHEIKKWLSSNERRMQLTGEAYYDGRHDILQRKRTVIGKDGELEAVENLPNNRIVDNQYAKMVDQKANYLCGKPVMFDVRNRQLGKELSGIFTKKVHRQIRLLAEYSLVGGKAWLFPYLNDKGEFTFAVYPAHEILPFWADSEHTELDCAVHFFAIHVYDEYGKESTVWKAEVIHGGGIECFIWDKGKLILDNDSLSGAFISATDADGKTAPYNWERLPLICFKANHREQPLLCKVKCLQDALNILLSNFANNMEEDIRNTILVLHNYDGENLGEFRHNLITYGAVKVRSSGGTDGKVDTLTIEVNADNYKAIIELLKKAIIENARGYDAKDERMNGTPNQMNIRSMYSDIDLDANGMETEFQAAFEDLMWFVTMHLINSGKGDYTGEDIRIVFNRDILVNESEAIDNCSKSAGLLSNETIIKQHPWIDNPEDEIARIAAEQKTAEKNADTYRQAFDRTKGESVDDTE